MQKPIQLQQRLIEQIPLLAATPEKLVIATGPGNVVATSAPSLSFEYRYPLTVTITDDALSETLVDLAVVTVLDWLQVNQPEILGNALHRLNDFTFTQQERSLALVLQLTERVQVSDNKDEVRTITHLPEPPLPENVALPRQVYLNGELISSWTV
ncbi:phage tail protein [Rahnella aceris]|uniref:phage tail protein n=1 Tax=Rahnella sp. (strain Y9602) TaxID=2703885 RepID=UPI001904C0D0|nr:phage tail protein [Rahnella aceris]QQN34697.1 phage tail protein [Rahnella aceris]